MPRFEAARQADDGDQHGQRLVWFRVLHSHQNFDEVALPGGRLRQRDAERDRGRRRGVGALGVVADLRRKTNELAQSFGFVFSIVTKFSTRSPSRADGCASATRSATAAAGAEVERSEW